MVAIAQSWISFIIVQVMWAFTALDPDSSVWILAGLGSGISALRGEPRGIFNGLLNWIAGMFASVAFVRGVDHFQPEAEAILVGIVSSEGLRVWQNGFMRWIGGVFPGRSNGGSNNAP